MQLLHKRSLSSHYKDCCISPPTSHKICERNLILACPSLTSFINKSLTRTVLVGVGCYLYRIRSGEEPVKLASFIRYSVSVNSLLDVCYYPLLDIGYFCWIISPSILTRVAIPAPPNCSMHARRHLPHCPHITYNLWLAGDLVLSGVSSTRCS